MSTVDPAPPPGNDPPKRRWRRASLIGGSALLLVLLATAGWLLVTGLQARTQLEAVRFEVHQLRSQISAGDLADARVTAQALRRHAADAHHLTTGPAWAAAAAVPYLGDPADTVRAVTSSADRIASDALPGLIAASQRLDPAKLRRPDGSFELAPLAQLAPTLNSAAAAMDAAVRSVDASPASTWLTSVDSARADVQQQLTGLASTMTAADVAADTAPYLLGAHGAKSYLVSFENEAELRGTGGLPGAFAIVRADHGRISFTRFENDGTLVDQPSGLDFGAEFNQLYRHLDPTNDYRQSNVSPNFPYAAQIWVAQWHRKTGQRLDGALALDPSALSDLLAVTGPAKLPDGTSVSASNVVQLTQQTVYDKYASADDNAARKAYLLRIARAVSSTLIGARSDPTALVRAGAQAVGEHRLLLWSADPAVEAQLARASIGGVLPRTAASYAGVALNNAMTGKLDYYLHASLDWSSSGCGSTRDVTATITLRNDAPNGLPAYVLGNVGQPGFPTVKGTNRTLINYFATPGALMSSVDLNGRPTGANVGAQLGHPVYSVTLTLPAGQPQTLVLHLREPAESGPPIVRAQPMVDPMTVAVHTRGC